MFGWCLCLFVFYFNPPSSGGPKSAFEDRVGNKGGYRNYSMTLTFYKYGTFPFLFREGWWGREGGGGGEGGWIVVRY